MNLRHDRPLTPKPISLSSGNPGELSKKVINRRQTDGEALRSITITRGDPWKKAASESGLLNLVCDGLREREHTPGGLGVTSIDAQTPHVRNSEKRNNATRGTSNFQDARLRHSEQRQARGNVHPKFPF